MLYSCTHMATAGDKGLIIVVKIQQLYYRAYVRQRADVRSQRVETTVAEQ